MTEDQAYAAVELLEDESYDARVDASYSGRGMYGATAVAIVTDAPLVEVGWALREAGVDDPADLPQRTDSMGRGTVIY